VKRIGKNFFEKRAILGHEVFLSAEHVGEIKNLRSCFGFCTSQFCDFTWFWNTDCLPIVGLSPSWNSVSYRPNSELLR